MQKYYMVYKTTNKVNGKFYIGVHQTTNLDDGYLGSGVYLRRAIEKYGRECFEREILALFDNPEDMFSLEGELVCEDLVVDKSCYNLVLGGIDGAFATHNRDANYKWARQKGRQAAYAKRDEWIDKWRRNMRTAQKLRYETFGPSSPNFHYDWTGKSHSEETKRKIGEANSRMVGEKNSQFGTCWVYNEDIKQSRKVAADEVEELLLAGWKRGRKMKF